MTLEMRWRLRRTTVGGLLIGLALLNATTLAAPTREPRHQRLQVALDDLQRYGALGAVLCVDAPDRPRLNLASGHVDAARQLAMTTDHAFQIGSQSKMFTAAAILLLERQGRLRLDDAVRRYVTLGPEDADVTIRQLLQHTSGIGDGIALIEASGEPPNRHVRLEDLLLLGSVSGREFPAGARWGYNNTGYALLGRIVEVVSGQTRAAFLRQRILEPLHMRTTWIGSEDDWSAVRMAHGFTWSDRNAGPIEMTRPEDLTWAGAAGDMIATADDLVRWARSLLPGNSTIGLSLQDFTGATVTTGLPDVMQDYGYGLGRYVLAGRSTWGHGGFIHGYITLSTVDPASRTVVVILVSLTGKQGTEFATLKSAVTALATAAYASQPD